MFPYFEVPIKKLLAQFFLTLAVVLPIVFFATCGKKKSNDDPGGTFGGKIPAEWDGSKDWDGSALKASEK